MVFVLMQNNYSTRIFKNHFTFIKTILRCSFLSATYCTEIEETSILNSLKQFFQAEIVVQENEEIYNKNSLKIGNVGFH